MFQFYKRSVNDITKTCFICYKTAIFKWIIFTIALTHTSASPLSLPCETSSVLCGQPAIQPTSARVINGQVATRGSWPWMVTITEENIHVCGGTVIAPDLVLTATHCFLARSNDATKWSVMAGKYRLDRYEIGQKSVKVKEIRTHPGFNITNVDNDIALVLLETPLPFSSLIRPACLPTEGQSVKDGEMCLLAGWGNTRDTSDQNALNQVALPVVSDAICRQPDWYGAAFALPNTTFCAGYSEGIKDGCTGDSGGPLLCLRGDGWYVHGILSWAYGCAERKWPGVYTEVDKYADWIQQEARALRGCESKLSPIVG